MSGNAALVTASSRGLGRASATALCRRGVDVVLNGRDEEQLAETVSDLEGEAAEDATVVGQPGDLTDEEDLSRLVERTIEEFGGMDHLVTSAGGPPSGPFMDTTDEDWYEAFDLLVMSVVRLVRESAEYLKVDGGGTIVNITSLSTKEAIDSLVLSNAVRMGVLGLEKTLSKELAPEVRANAVLPGAHETSRIQDLVEQAVERGEYGSYEAGLEARGADIPTGGIGDPIELGEVVAFLCSPRSSFVNGVAIPIDGGASASNL
jgi:NAD(P)-dependent dehydrogenase (short-subunit alcohol dehydrogenase family)